MGMIDVVFAMMTLRLNEGGKGEKDPRLGWLYMRILYSLLSELIQSFSLRSKENYVAI